MNSTKTPTKTTNPIINSVLVFSVGLTALEFTLLIFNPSNAISSITSLEFNSIFREMFEGMFLSADTLGSFWAVLVAWGISGLIAGVRAKRGTWGAIAGFFGTLGGAGFLASLNIPLLSAETIPKFGMGAVACIIITCVAAYATGNATTEKPRKAGKVITRKAWHESKTKDVWTCNRCGNSIPPGAFACPKCGEPVIE